MIEQFTIEAVDAPDALRNIDLVAEWDALLDRKPHLNVMYASSCWVGNVIATSATLVRLWLVRDSSNELVGLVPACLGKFDLRFSVGNRNLFRKRLTAAYLLGSVPVLPECDGIFERIMSSILKDWNQCDCVYLNALPTDSHWWGRIQNLGMPDLLSHVVDGPRPWHVLHLAVSFDDYLKTLSSKSRSELRRRSRKAGETPHGAVNVCCYSTPQEAGEFLEGAAEVSRHSWQHRDLGERVCCDEAARRSFEDLAARGILRSYLLHVGTTPCAFVVGYQHSGVYLPDETGYRKDFSELSPGTALWFSIIEDLHKHNIPKSLNFGLGDHWYKQRFGNCERSDASCLIFRRTVGTRLLTTGHSLFSRLKKFAKKLLGREGHEID